MTILQPPPRPRPRLRWRTPVTLVAALAFLVGGTWWGWTSLTDSTAEPNCVDQTLPNDRLVSRHVVVNVYNGGATAGTARQIATDLRRRGFNIGKVANEPSGDKVDGSTVRGSTAGAPEVVLIAGQLPRPPKVVADDRVDHTVDLVVGIGFRALNGKGRPSVQVPPGSVHCLPPIRPTQAIPSGQNPN